MNSIAAFLAITWRDKADDHASGRNIPYGIQQMVGQLDRICNLEESLGSTSDNRRALCADSGRRHKGFRLIKLRFANPST